MRRNSASLRSSVESAPASEAAQSRARVTVVWNNVRFIRDLRDRRVSGRQR
jgi:hypothetical protein